jgi:hypothetical protein
MNSFSFCNQLSVCSENNVSVSPVRNFYSAIRIHCLPADPEPNMVQGRQAKSAFEYSELLTPQYFFDPPSSEHGFLIIENSCLPRGDGLLRGFKLHFQITLSFGRNAGL